MVYCVSPFFFFSLSHYVLQPCSEEHVNTLSRLIAPRSSRASSFSPIRFCTYPEKAIRTCTHRVHALREDVCTSTWCFSPSMHRGEKRYHRARKRTPLLCHCRRCRYLPDGHSTWQPAGNLFSGWAFHTADNSHRIACGQRREPEARTIDSSSKRKRRCFDIFSHLCFQGSRTHLEPFSRFYKSKEPLYTDPPSPLHRCAHTRLFSLRFLLRRKW